MEKLRDLLARRLRELMSERPDLDVQTKVAQKSGVSQSTVQRVLAKEQAATVDVLDDLARAFDVKPARHFLLDKAEIGLLKGFGLLSPDDKARIMAFIDVAAQSSKGAMEPNQLTFGSVRQAPPEMHAALERASGREPASLSKKDTDGKKAKPEAIKRRKAQ